MADSIKILLFDCSTCALAQVLRLHGYIVRTAEDSEQTLSTLAEDSSFDIALIDMDAPEYDGWSALIDIRKSDFSYNNIPIICFSKVNSNKRIIKSLNFGADDYIIKPVETEVIIARINAVLRRSKSKEIEKPENNVTNNQKTVFKSLTAREKDVLLLVTQGLDNKSIAKELYVSTITVKAHLQSIFKKLKVKSRTQAVLTVMENNLISKEK